jgi:hypothetical protein
MIKQRALNILLAFSLILPSMAGATTSHLNRGRADAPLIDKDLKDALVEALPAMKIQCSPILTPIQTIPVLGLGYCTASEALRIVIKAKNLSAKLKIPVNAFIDELEKQVRAVLAIDLRKLQLAYGTYCTGFLTMYLGWNASLLATYMKDVSWNTACGKNLMPIVKAFGAIAGQEEINDLLKFINEMK